ncbi:hypothetical protein B0T13DRAFT_391768 [Neurospora crassa]|nr:hypothetical protein B0T13DRAFT_391768 [Neurospora crassa]
MADLRRSGVCPVLHFPTNTSYHPANTPSYPVNIPYYPVNTPIPPLRINNPVRSNQPVSLTVYSDPTSHAIRNNGLNGNGNIIPLNTSSANPLDNNQPSGHHYPTSNPIGASVRDVAPGTSSQPMNSNYHPNNHHLAGTPSLGASHNAIPNPPHLAVPSFQATTHIATAVRPPVVRPAVPSGQSRVCQGSRRQGIHYPCVNNPPKRVWKIMGQARKCRECLANKPSAKACRSIDALEAAGLEPCSNCYVKAARGNGGGGLCPDCLADKQANAKLRKQGKNKGRKGDDDNVPRGGSGGGPLKGDGGGGGGFGPTPGAVGVVLSGIDQMAY